MKNFFIQYYRTLSSPIFKKAFIVLFINTVIVLTSNEVWYDNLTILLELIIFSLILTPVPRITGLPKIFCICALAIVAMFILRRVYFMGWSFYFSHWSIFLKDITEFLMLGFSLIIITYYNWDSVSAEFLNFKITLMLSILFLMFLGLIIGVEYVFTTTQILWIGIVSDGILKRGFKKSEKPEQKRQPDWVAIFINVFYITSVSCLFLTLPFFSDLYRKGEIIPRTNNGIYFYTAFFMFFIIINLINAFNFHASPLKDKRLLFFILLAIIIQIVPLHLAGETLRCQGLNFLEYLSVILLALTVIPVNILWRKCGQSGLQ